MSILDRDNDTLWVSENYINATKGYRYGENEPYESYHDNMGDLYRSCLQEFGRCIGKVYHDTISGNPEHCGWVFQKRVEYTDNRPWTRPEDRTYLQETWVTVHKPPEWRKVAAHSLINFRRHGHKVGDKHFIGGSSDSIQWTCKQCTLSTCVTVENNGGVHTSGYAHIYPCSRSLLQEE